MLVRACELIKKCCLSAVLIAYQCIGKLRSLRERVLILLRMEFSFLTQSRMLRLLPINGSFVASASFSYSLNLNLCRLHKAQCEFVSMNLQLHRVPHGSQLHNSYLCSRNHTHIKEVLS